MKRTHERGQTLAETGIVLLLLVSLGMAIVDFGRMLMLVNMVTSATRDAARVASAVPRVDRSANGDLCDQGPIQDIVINQLKDVGLTITAGDVQIDRSPASNPPTIKVTTTVNIPWIALFNLVGSSLSVDREVTFRDEHTTGSGC
jgi:Flp pilus assembly protein TadG